MLTISHHSKHQHPANLTNNNITPRSLVKLEKPKWGVGHKKKQYIPASKKFVKNFISIRKKCLLISFQLIFRYLNEGMLQKRHVQHKDVREPTLLNQQIHKNHVKTSEDTRFIKFRSLFPTLLA